MIWQWWRWRGKYTLITFTHWQNSKHFEKLFGFLRCFFFNGFLNVSICCLPGWFWSCIFMRKNKRRKNTCFPALDCLQQPLVYSLALCHAMLSRLVYYGLVWAWGLRATAHTFMNNNALRLPGTNIDPMTSELGRCQQRVQKLPILNPFALLLYCIFWLLGATENSPCRHLGLICSQMRMMSCITSAGR